MKTFSFLLIITSSLLFLFCNKDYKTTHYFSEQEYHRQIAFKDLLYDYSDLMIRNDNVKPYLDSIYIELKYTIPDSIPQDDIRIEYINRNPDIPEYIKMALFEERDIELMTVGEFMLAMHKIAAPHANLCTLLMR